MSNNLYIASAGAGKTTHLVNSCAGIKGDVLITTFTESNAEEIRRKLHDTYGTQPSNVRVETWFRFLLQNFVRPYQSAVFEELHEVDIGFLLVSKKSGFRYKNKQGRSIYWGEDSGHKYYFNKDNKVYSDKISRFSLEANKQSSGAVIERLSKIYSSIFIDEVQDMAGYDLEVIKLLLDSSINVDLVGDPRQVTYTTHFSTKYKKYYPGKIKEFIETELGKKIVCNVDEKTLLDSHRCPEAIAGYASLLYPEFSPTKSCSLYQSEKQGVYRITPDQVQQYLEDSDAVQLRWDSRVNVVSDYPVFNLGESKGMTFDRVVIYPTKDMAKWVIDHSYKLTDITRSKFYVGLTRARGSVLIVLDKSIECDLDVID